MFLEHIDIRGFRGINHLSIRLDPTTALIGENTWGKTSLLRALWCLLGQDEVPYQFIIADFHQQEPPAPTQLPRLQIELTFREYRPEMCHHSERLSRLEPVWVRHKDKFHRIHYRATAELWDDGEIISEHCFLNVAGQIIELADVQHYIELLMLMNPVLRLRDARAARGVQGVDEQWEANLMALADNLTPEPQSIGQQEVKAGLRSVRHLITHYFSSVPPLHAKPRSQRDIISRPASLRGLGSLNDLLHCGDMAIIQPALSGIVSALLVARGDRLIDAGARPILILEDPESRLHPTMLALAWGLLEQLPGQKLLTTNSGDLLSSIPLSQIRRLVRKQDVTLAFQLLDAHFSAEDMRRIAFHVRINRPMALFARSWLLVEGETEIWLLSELAHICGFSLRCEGVRIIEYAQCGYIPLIKLAKDLGIEWHLLADGDPAGLKYISGARSQLKGERERDRLTALPARDIEHFLFENGFEEVYRREAGIKGQQSYPTHKIISKAINHRSKPGMALAVVEEAERLGEQSIPALLRKMFARVVAQARSEQAG